MVNDGSLNNSALDLFSPSAGIASEFKLYSGPNLSGPLQTVQTNSTNGAVDDQSYDPTTGKLIEDFSILPNGSATLNAYDPTGVPEYSATINRAGQLTRATESSTIQEPRFANDVASTLAAQLITNFLIKHNIALSTVATSFSSTGISTLLGVTNTATQGAYIAASLSAGQQFLASYGIDLANAAAGLGGSIAGADLFKAIGLPSQVGSVIGSGLSQQATASIINYVSVNFSPGSVGTQLGFVKNVNGALDITNIAYEIADVGAEAISNYLGGKISNLIIGSPNEGATIGGAAGTAIGAAAGPIVFSEIVGETLGSELGPVGVLLGATLGKVIGELIGDIFGPGKSVGPNASCQVSFDGTSTWTPRFAAEDNGGNPSIAANLAQGVCTELQSIFTSVGGRFVNPDAELSCGMGYYAERGFFSYFKPGPGALFFSTPQAAIDNAVLNILRASPIDGGNPYMEYALAHSKATTVAGLINDLNAAHDFGNYVSDPTLFDLSMVASGSQSQLTSWAMEQSEAQSLGLANISPGADGAYQYFVTNTNDSGPGSLRQALTFANQFGGDVDFDLTTQDPGFKPVGPAMNGVTPAAWIFQPLSPLPALNGDQAISIYGLSQESWTNTNPGGLQIEIDGSKAGSGTDGLSIASSGKLVFVEGLDIVNFSGNGILISGSGSDCISSCYIGVNSTGLTAEGNGQSGISIQAGSADNQIQDSVISGNAGAGIHISGGGADGNEITGNMIGTDLTGTIAVPNGGSGVLIDKGAQWNLIGGTTQADRNIISGSTGNAIQISGTGTDGDMIEGNYIGLDSRGTKQIANGGDGVLIGDGPRETQIGGTSAGERNYIAGNLGFGIELDGGAAAYSSVQNNVIGTSTVYGVQILNALGGAAVGVNAPTALLSYFSDETTGIASSNTIAGGVQLKSIAAPVTTPVNQTNNSRPMTRSIIPAYFGNVPDCLPDWEKVIADDVPGKAEVMLIVNIGLGVGGRDGGPLIPSDWNAPEVTAFYRQVLVQAYMKGIKLLGYVSTNYGNRPIADVERDIASWKAMWPGITGIFLDEQATGTDANPHAAMQALPYYEAIRQYVLQQFGPTLNSVSDPRVVTNPGNVGNLPNDLQAYLGSGSTVTVADIMDIYEDSNLSGYTPPSWVKGYASGRFSILLYGQPSLSAFKAAVNDHAGNVYVTSLTEDQDPWSGLTPNWASEVDVISQLNANLHN